MLNASISDLIKMNFAYPVAEILFTLYLLLYFPLDALWRSLRPATVKPVLTPLQSYWRQGRYVLGLLCAFMLVSWLGNYSAQQLGLGLPPPPAGMWGLAIIVILLVSLHFIGNMMGDRMTPEQRASKEQELRSLPFPMPGTLLETTVYLITMIGMTATWELLFRGYLLLVLTPYTGMPLAVVLAAVAYGAGHGYQNPKQFIGSIASSLCFTIGYALTGSLWWLIVLHAAVPAAMPYAVRKLNRA
jgi:membrane protease YdiL (CAAX protease family)